MDSRPTLFILDAYSRIYQVFHAIREGMTGPTGQPTHAVYGILRDMLAIRRTKKPDYFAAAFDGSKRLTRSDLSEDYKANRGPMPDDLRAQIPVIRRVFEAFQIPILTHEGAEADDVIATLARRAAERGLEVTILTSDKDARQLLTDQIHILNLRDNKILDVAGLQKDWGITPEQVVDYLALTGDSVDNVPGIPGIGPKNASKLISEFGTLEALLAGANKVSGKKMQQNLKEHADVARVAKTLIQLQENLPLELDWDRLKTTDYDAKALRAICFECGFHAFLDEIDDTEKPPETLWNVQAYETINTPERLKEFAAELEKLPAFSVDTETTSTDPLKAEIVGYSFSWKEGEAYYIPVRGPIQDTILDPQLVADALRPALTDPKIEKIGQNLKYDLLVMNRLGIAVQGPITDTMVLSYLLESGERNHGLDELSRRLLDHTMIPITALIGKGKNQLRMDQVDVQRVTEYAGEDADAGWRLYEILSARCRDENLWTLYADLERPLISILAAMETAGIKVDVPRLRALSVEFGARLDQLRGAIYEVAGREFNIGSGPQLRQILFEELKLPVISKTPKGEPSTAVEVLEELAAKHPLPRLIIQHRQTEKLKSTYLDALAEIAHEDGRVHTSFNQVVAATGRLSSSDPNLQNIPTRTEEGRQIRQAFVAGYPGWTLLTADYSQIELRILAHYCEDPALVKAFAENRDIHSVVASQIFNVPESEVTSSQRRVAKTVNFGVIYGLSAFGLASRLGISQTEAAAFIDAYFREYAGVDAFINQAREIALKTGKVETILGRRRAITGIKNITGRNLNQAERLAVNTIIQGSAADLIKKAMLDVDRNLRESGMNATMLLQIHDELLFEAPKSKIPALAKLVRETMTNALPFRVPILVDVATGPNWLDVATIDD